MLIGYLVTDSNKILFYNNQLIEATKKSSLESTQNLDLITKLFQLVAATNHVHPIIHVLNLPC